MPAASDEPRRVMPQTDVTGQSHRRRDSAAAEAFYMNIAPARLGQFLLREPGIFKSSRELRMRGIFANIERKHQPGNSPAPWFR